MKNRIIALLTLAILGTIACSIIKDRVTSPYLLTAVEASIKTIASSSGLKIEKHQRATASSQIPILDSLSIQAIGRPIRNDIDEYLLKDGSEDVRVRVDHSLGKVGSVEISSSSKHAEFFRSGLTTAFPGLNCQIKGS